MKFSGQTKKIAVIALGSSMVALAVALNVGWVLINWRTAVPLVLGVLFFLAIIAGIVLYTIFLVREIRRNEQHDAFINAVTHELKTPVASIRLYLETLQTREVDEARRREFYDIMLSDADRLLRTIEQVLRAGKLSPSRRLQYRTEIDLKTLIEDCLLVARHRHHLPGEAAELVADLPEGEKASIIGDPDEMQAALLNLFDNAVKYSTDKVRIRVELAREDARRLAVRVIDQGVGISRDQLKHLFKRFYRIPGSVALRVKGTGLGLFIVRSVAEKHGGKVFAESPGLGRGSTFTMLLPRSVPPGGSGDQPTA